MAQNGSESEGWTGTDVSAHGLFYWNGQDEAQENGKKQGGDNTKVQ